MLLCGVKKCLLFPVEAREYLVVIWYERTMSFRKEKTNYSLQRHIFNKQKNLGNL